MDALIEATGAGITLGGNRILRDVDFRIHLNEIVTVLGPNGSGKTTLLRMLTGALAPSEGKVRRRPGLRIGYAPQSLAVDRTMPMTVERFVALAANGGRHRDTLDRVGLNGLGNRQLAALSGGEFQRALLARALVREPDLLALDEPTQGLDQPGTVAFYRLIETVREELGCAILMVSHDLHVVMSASDRVICVNGHICCEGTPKVVSSAPEYRALFGTGTEGTLALYQHHHDHRHGHSDP